MFIHSFPPPRRAAATFAFAAAVAISLAVFPSAQAQTDASKVSDLSAVSEVANGAISTQDAVTISDKSSESSSSSSVAANAPSDLSSGFASSQDVAPVPAPDPSPSPTPSRAQHDSSYGYGNGGHHMFGLNHLAWEAGGGANAPIGNDAPVITWGGNFTAGAGLKFQRHVSLLAEYQFMDNKLPGGLIADAGAQGGHAHIWSLTLDPVIDLLPNRRNDVYLTGGGGFYRKVTSFTDPVEVEECYYFCEIGVEDVTVSHFSSNQGGVNFGFGITHKVSSDSDLKVFAEARYVWINTPPVGTQDGLGTTELIPVTFGVRW